MPEQAPHSSQPLRLARVESHPARQVGADEMGSLTAAAARGDEAAFHALHARLDAGLRRMLTKRTVGRAELADELTQRAWTIAWQALRAGKYDPARASFSTFLYAVATRAWLQHLRESSRRSARAERLPEDLAGLVPDSDDPEELTSFAELLDAVRACLRGREDETLTDQERAIVSATARGEPDRAAAKRLGLAPSTLNARKLAALGKLRRRLARLGFRLGDGGDEGKEGRES